MPNPPEQHAAGTGEHLIASIVYPGLLLAGYYLMGSSFPFWQARLVLIVFAVAVILLAGVSLLLPHHELRRVHRTRVGLDAFSLWIGGAVLILEVIGFIIHITPQFFLTSFLVVAGVGLLVLLVTVWFAAFMPRGNVLDTDNQ